MNQILKRTLHFNKNSLKAVFRGIIGTEQHKNDNNRFKSKNSTKIFWGIAGAATFMSLYKYLDIQKSHVYAIEEDVFEAGVFRSDLPIYSTDEISRHTTTKNGIWVIYKQGVYDITEFIESHPGGEIILLAAGSSIEPFWMIYGIHKTEEVFEILEEMRIGNISKEEYKSMSDNLHDPYSTDPSRSAALRPASEKPFNAEPPPETLIASFITPNDLFYVRNHLPVPVVDENSYRLQIEIEGCKKLITLSLDDLKKFEVHDITATLMCAGNRRSEMSKVRPVKGLNWNQAVVGNAVWTGVLLRDVLRSISLREEDNFKHVQFQGLDVDPLSSDKRYGASVPFHTAVDKNSDILLAFKMNGEPLPRDHGFPLRVIIPGVCGARNVKWLKKIIVANEESPAFWQQHDYKNFNPSTDFDTADYSKARAIQQLPVTSAICLPLDGEVVKTKDGAINVKGYAWSGGGQQIYRVDVTADGGKTWHEAYIDHQKDTEPPKHWSWTLWSANIPINPNVTEVEIWARAIDSSHNTQPESFEHIWNFRGVLSNAYHRIKVRIDNTTK